MPVLPEKRFIVACARLKRLVFAIPQESGLSPAEICKLQSLDECRAGLRLDQGSGDAALVVPARQARMDLPKALRKRLRRRMKGQAVRLGRSRSYGGEETLQ